MSVSVIWPALFVGLAWWGGTGLILSLNHRPPATFKRSLTIAVAMAFLVLASLPLVSSSRSVLACYAAFAMALVLWGVVEMSLLMGFITGPRRQPSSGEMDGDDSRLRFPPCCFMSWRYWRLAAVFS